jgi:DNA polymerase
MPIFHPSYLLRNPSRQQGSPKWLTWQDLQEVRRRLDACRGGADGAGGGEPDPTPSLL